MDFHFPMVIWDFDLRVNGNTSTDVVDTFDPDKMPRLLQEIVTAAIDNATD